MNSLDTQYQNLLKDILENGHKKQDRTSTGTISVFGRTIRHKMSDGFPLLTTKKMYVKGVVAELLWFLEGRTDLKSLLNNDCNIWVGDAYKRFKGYVREEWEDGALNELEEVGFIVPEKVEGKDISYRPLNQEEFIDKIKANSEFENQFGDLGPIYGKQWRAFTGVEVNRALDGTPIGWKPIYIDQIKNLINGLKTNPDSRRLMVNAWNPSELQDMVLPPCHYGFQVYTRELSHKERCDLFGHNDSIDRDYSYSKWLDDNGFPKRAISLMWNQRSVDTFLGLPFNIASYGLLLEIVAKTVNMVPDELIGNLGDTHLYLNHIEQAKEQITREPYELPKLIHMKTDAFYKSLSESLSLFIHLDVQDFKIENYKSHATIKAPLSN